MISAFAWNSISNHKSFRPRARTYFQSRPKCRTKIFEVFSSWEKTELWDTRVRENQVRENKVREDQLGEDQVRGDQVRRDQVRRDQVRGDQVRGDQVRNLVQRSLGKQSQSRGHFRNSLGNLVPSWEQARKIQAKLNKNEFILAPIQIPTLCFNGTLILDVTFSKS